MADFAAEDLLEHAELRFGQSVLRNRMRGALGDTGLADDELLKIAESVVTRVRAAAAASIGWPLPGETEAGVAYRVVWPPDLLQHALELFNWRTLSGLESVSDQQRRVGVLAETYFDQVQSGAIGIAIGGTTDVTPFAPVAARDRTGAALLGSLTDRDNTLSAFQGGGWDYLR